MLKVTRPALLKIACFTITIAIAAGLGPRARASASGSPQQGASGPASSAVPPSSQAILVQAIKLHQAGDFVQAIREYRRYLMTDPRSFVAHANLGAALDHQGQYAGAISEYEKALKLRPGNPQVRLNLAIAHYQALDLEEAVKELVPLHSAMPSNMQIALLLGDSYFRLGEYSKTEQLLEPLEGSSSQQKALDYLLGMSLLRDGKVKQAEPLINKIMSNGDSPEAHLMLGEARLSINDTPGAIKELRKALALDPKLPLAHWLYGKAMLESGHRNQAMLAFKEELAIDPNEYDPNVYLGASLNQALKYQEALPYLLRAIQVRPGSAQAGYQVAVAEIGLGQLQQAKQRLEDLVKRYPNFVEAHISLASVYYRLHMTQPGNRERMIVIKLNQQIQARKKAQAQAAQATYDGSAAPPGAKTQNSPSEVLTPAKPEPNSASSPPGGF